MNTLLYNIKITRGNLLTAWKIPRQLQWFFQKFLYKLATYCFIKEKLSSNPYLDVQFFMISKEILFEKRT